MGLRHLPELFRAHHDQPRLGLPRRIPLRHMLCVRINCYSMKRVVLNLLSVMIEIIIYTSTPAIVKVLEC